MNGSSQYSEKPLNDTPTQNSSTEHEQYPSSLVPNDEPNLIHNVQSPSDLERRESVAVSPPPIAATAPPARTYHPLSWHVVALLAFPAVLGVLARLGVHALTTYDGDSVFALAWVQGMGCFVMGLAVGRRETITN
ncbi:hypothetical protein FS749_001903 [Ceratobasidium sp. UAMH 11750]|nr:hypothetical protein FS749_001903 [Ceratobasidium sp. UAMH 11750]